MGIFTSIFIMMIFVFIVLGGISAAAKNKKINKNNHENHQSFEEEQQEMLEKHHSDDADVQKRIEKLKQMREYLDTLKDDEEFSSSDKMEDEIMRREGFEVTRNDSQSHDNACNENNCDGCGSDDVYAQVYGKRKKNKLKKK